MIGSVKPIDWAALAFLVLAWGSSFGLNKIAVESVTPLWVMATRVLLASLILLIIALFRRMTWSWRKREWLWMFWLGLCGNVIPFFLIGWGTQFIPSSLAGILMAVNPLIVLVLVWLLLPDEKAHARHLVGFGLGFVGVVLVMGPQALGDFSFAGPALVAEFALIGAAGCYALLNVCARLAPPMDLMMKSVGVLVSVTPLSLVLAYLDEPSGLAGAEVPALIAIILMAVFPTAIATLVLFALVQRAGSRFVALSNYLVPVLATFLGTTFLAESLNHLHYAGLFVILAGIYVSERRLRAKSL